MSARFKALQETYPKKEIKKFECYTIDGEFLVDRQTISAIMKVAGRTTQQWQAKGMEDSIYSKKRLMLFSIDDVKAWHKENNYKDRQVEVVDNTEPMYLSGLEDEVNDIEGKIKQANKVLQIKSTTSEEADRVLKIMNALIKSIEAGKLSRELVPKKDVEKIILEMVTTVISGYKNDIKILPKEYENRSWVKIQPIMEANYKSNIENFQKLLKIKGDGRVYEIIAIVNDLLLWGASPSEITNALISLKEMNE